jgi:hypothetical protein
LGGWGQEDHGLRPVQAKKFTGFHFSRKKPGVVAPTCHPSNNEKHKIRIMLQAGLGKK